MDILHLLSEITPTEAKSTLKFGIKPRKRKKEKKETKKEKEKDQEASYQLFFWAFFAYHCGQICSKVIFQLFDACWCVVAL